ncbi:MAG TPA: 6-phospho-beta-glucosidase [Candidatus Hydrogenedens sp.]|nr:6-phospho-beta-glucosidase [Candidatus Hydrogenedens sp.]
MKLAVIGGGSSYTPELVDGIFAQSENFLFEEIWLMDQNPQRLDINHSFSERLAQRYGSKCKIYKTTDVNEALSNARYVLTQIRVGQMQSRINDEKLGLKYGILGQETTGIGGFACALRTIPVILDIARTMEQICPDAFLINFTNPAGINTEAVIKYSKIRTIGLCNVPIGIIMQLIKFFGGTPEEVELDYVGLNHLSWVRKFKVRGNDITREVLQKFWEHADEEWEDETTRNNMLEAMKSLNMFCNYYLQYYYSIESVLNQLKKKEKTRGEEVLEIERILFEKYSNPKLREKPEELSKRGGAHYSTAALMVIDAIENNKKSRQIVCCKNNGAIPTFDDDISVEVSAIIDKYGAHAIPQLPPEHSIRGLMQLIKAYETLTVHAAVNGDKELAFQAMLSHPLMPDASGCKKLLNEVLEINKPFLNNFF